MKKPGVYYDISPLVGSQTAVFPGDVPFQRHVALDFKNGDHLLLSSITSTLHIGAHADAPNHYLSHGDGISERDLNRYMGRCQVVTVDVAPGARVGREDLPPEFKVLAPRVLFRTRSFPEPNIWNPDFNSLSPELVDWLASEKVILIGLDTPSVDPETSKALESHQALARHDVSVLEGLWLEEVSDGLYTLLALPLPLEEADASPVRAILLPQADLFSSRDPYLREPDTTTGPAD